jgi:putative drug exporter of the RND superfamily
MFHFLGAVVARFWPVVFVVWGAALAAGFFFAPSWNDVTQVGEVESLPAESPSVRASTLFREAFPLDYAPSSVVLLYWREDGPLQDADRKFIEEEVAAAVGELATQPESGINTIRTLADPQVGTLLVSGDRKATVVLVELATAFQDPRANPVVDRIERALVQLNDRMPDGLQFRITGSATAGRDLQRAEIASIRVIEIATIIIVIVLLLLLYRAPLVALIPLATVFVAVAVAIPLLAALAGAGVLEIFRDLRVFVTVLAYGAGVDYCLFLIARYREELDAGVEPGAAIAAAIGHVSPAIVASAGTTIVGIGMLTFAQFAKIHQAGVIIPFALGIVLLGALTFGAALLRVAGRWAFWPQRIVGQEPAPPGGGPDQTERYTRRGWDGPASLLSRLVGGSPRFNLWGKLASLLLRRPGTIWLTSVLVMLPFAAIAIHFRDNVNFNPLSDLPPDAPSVVGTHKLTEHFPPGMLGSVTVLVQQDGLDFTGEKGIHAIEQLTDELRNRRLELDLADVRSVSLPLGTTAGAKERLARISGTPAEVEKVVREEALPYYVGQDNVTRLELTLATDPLTRPGIRSVAKIQEALPSLLPPELADARVEVAGTAASLRDLGVVKAADERLIQMLVPVVVFLLLLFLFRRVVLSGYLILSVLFSYFATLGATYVVFRLLEGPDFVGLDWKVTVFLFTILIAVGVDYNIFLLTRVREEQKRHGSLAAIPIALTRTGRVISSCGFIMAGTFASLLSGSLRALQELGFALALGVLIDTMIVRPLLVPAFLVLLQRLIPGPTGRYMALGEREPARAAQYQASRRD